jgi:hypothetical protein
MTATISADFPFGPHFVEVFGSKPRLAARARPEEHYAGRPRLGLGSRLPLRLLARCALLARRAHPEF